MRFPCVRASEMTGPIDGHAVCHQFKLALNSNSDYISIKCQRGVNRANFIHYWLNSVYDKKGLGLQAFFFL